MAEGSSGAGGAPPAGAQRGATRAERDAARRARAESAPSSAAGRRSGRSGARERPPPPWGSFPLTELVTLLGIVLAVGGLVVGVEENRGRTMLVAGIALGALAGLETSIRDHFAGYRSHTTLLAGFLAILALVAITFGLKAVAPGLAGPVAFTIALAVGAIVFTIAFVALRRVFQRRSGGLSYR